MAKHVWRAVMLFSFVAAMLTANARLRRSPESPHDFQGRQRVKHGSFGRERFLG